MEISRRKLLLGATIVSTITTSSSLSACSPADISNLGAPNRFFALCGRGQLVKAKAILTSDASLSVLSSVGATHYNQAQDIVDILGRLLGSEGFHMIGDNDSQSLGGMYWRSFGPWICSDMLKGDAIDLGFCSDGSSHSLFNVYVDAEPEPERIKTILLLESRSLVIQTDTNMRETFE